MDGGGFLDYIGYRNMVTEDKIDEIVESGEDIESADYGDLDDYEKERAKKEIEARRYSR